MHFTTAPLTALLQRPYLSAILNVLPVTSADGAHKRARVAEDIGDIVQAVRIEVV